MTPKRKWLALGIAAAGCVATAFLYPVSPAISPAETLPWRCIACLLALGLLGGIGAAKSGQRKLWYSAAVLAGCLTAGSLVWRSASSDACVAPCNSRPMVIGTELRDYVSTNGESNADLLFDAGCNAERAWKPASIANCRMKLLLSGLASIPLASLFAASLIQAAAARRVWCAPAQPRRIPAEPQPGACAYDAFISYRHSEPDRAFALDLLERLEQAGFKVAFDQRDFRPNQPVIGEMERCILESRFTLCVVSPRYISSGYCSEEAEVCKTLDMEQRRRRLVPLFLERAAVPAWFGGVAGIDFSSPDTEFDPYARIAALLASAPANSWDGQA